MELRHLRYFAALAEQLSFTVAAQKVHVTQSTLSHQIRQLEEELGCRLFEREGRRVTMTEAGELFLERVRNALREVDEGVSTVRYAAEEMTGVVRIGATHTFNLHIIPRCVSLFLDRHPSVRVDVLEMTGDGIAQALLRGDLDIGVTYKPNDALPLRFEPLYTEEMMLAVGLRHPFAKRRFVRVSELHLQRMVLLPRSFSTRVLLDESFRMANAAPVVVAEMNAIAPMIELVRETDIATIVSTHALRREDVKLIPLESPTPVRSPGLLWRRDEARTPAARSFASIVRSVSDSESRDTRRNTVRAARR
ncbi:MULTISPECIES: LysR substrate-binding domain-containing protein [Paraburkholderia]|jgi:LysR family cyn operon transcriptional activator|uniref:LysR family transcriptional regulator n=1 Tax=Paraburkholderia terrae TaxID=311230 RepID=A0A2I8EZT3_9BURK|nr:MULTISPECIES: LysR substrate-binding domain-containing protein [Paraburkholderia]EUC15786.1 transcriptional regulator, LysR family [Burkholderia sp. BT03]SOE84212.1 transcriptional regulator, LysR family [Burkholderia sp. YR290]AUT65147.1 LysR family transcriptional regulator [Paraburkholderia terrae]OUL96691.1 LysR family transcriptional regulator [Paraburkholderia hospita]SKD00732.1 transcriptional regulator, LysR family [Paraburkholderia hospita]